MKNRIYILSFVLFTIFGLSAFIISNESSAGVTDKSENWGDQARFVSNVFIKDNRNAGNEPKFYVHSFYGVYGSSDRTLTVGQMRTAKTIEDIIANYPHKAIENCESVWVKSLFKDGEVSIMTKGSELNKEQLSLLNSSEIGDYFNVIVNYGSNYSCNGNLVYDRLDIGITVVPEVQAEYPDGYSKLIAYLDGNSKERMENMDFSNIQSLSIKFFIDEDGKADEIRVMNESGNPELDDIVVELLNDMPEWKPARDEDGNHVRQEFELIFGAPGC